MTFVLRCEHAEVKKELEGANNLLDVSKSRVAMEENPKAMSAVAASRY